MEINKDVVYFELNNWFSGRDYPNAEPFITWICENKFSNDEWLKENKLVCVKSYVDMSMNFVLLLLVNGLKKIVQNLSVESMKIILSLVIVSKMVKRLLKKMNMQNLTQNFSDYMEKMLNLGISQSMKKKILVYIQMKEKITICGIMMRRINNEISYYKF